MLLLPPLLPAEDSRKRRFVTKQKGSTLDKRAEARPQSVPSQGPWRHLEAVEFATLEWIEWFNHRRLLEPIGYVPPAEYEARYYEKAPAA